MHVYDPKEFTARLASGEMKDTETLEIVGVASPIEGSSSLIGFSRVLSCPKMNWITLPIDMVESIAHLRFLGCHGREYPVVRVKFKKPNEKRQDLAFLLGLCSQLKSSAARALETSGKTLSRRRFDRELPELQSCEIYEFDGEVYICCDGECGGLV